MSDTAAAAMTCPSSSGSRMSAADSDAAILSPEQLIRCFSKKQPGGGLPSLGEKRTGGNGQEEDTETPHRLGLIFDLLAEPRVSQRSQLTEAVWEAERGMARVTKACGKHWEAMGQAEKGGLWLRPEEALFLLESNQLLLTTCGDAAVSIQRAYQVMIDPKRGCSLEEYRTYSHLAKLGFKVVRHVSGCRSDSEVEEVKQLEVDRILDSIPNCYKRTQMTLATPPVELLPHHTWPKQSAYVFAVQGPTLTPNKMAVKRPMEDHVAMDASVHAGPSGADRPPPATSHSWSDVVRSEDNPWADNSTTAARLRLNPDHKWDKWRGLNCQGSSKRKKASHKGNRLKKRRGTHFDQGNAALGNVGEDIATVNHFDLVTVKTPSFARQSRQGAKETTLTGGDYCQEAATSETCASPTNWNSPTVQQSSDDDDDEASTDSSLADGPLSALWRGKTKPLLQPRHAKSTWSILRRIQIKPNVFPSAENERSNIKISFDVYFPRVTFRKSAPHPPNYRLAVIPSSEPIPSQGDLQRLVKDLRDNVPLLCAVCSPGAVTFYCFSQVDLPTDISMG